MTFTDKYGRWMIETGRLKICLRSKDKKFTFVCTKAGGVKLLVLGRLAVGVCR